MERELNTKRTILGKYEAVKKSEMKDLKASIAKLTLSELRLEMLVED